MTEPLRRIAGFAFDWAETFCDPDHGCMGYHRMWPLSRLLNNGGMLPAGQDFFGQQIAAVARDGKVHVLISGGADTGLMALAVEGANASGLDLHITAVDRCQTPLEEMRLYGAAIGVPVQTFACTLDQLPQGLAVDAIFGHSVLPFIAPHLRGDVFESWARVLRAGGRLALSQRLGKSYPKIVDHLGEEGLLAQHNELHETLSQNEIWQTIATRDAIVAAAKAFWLAPMERHLITEKDIHQLAAQAGLILHKITAIAREDKRSPSPYANTDVSDQKVMRHEIVLQKPDL